MTAKETDQTAPLPVMDEAHLMAMTGQDAALAIEVIEIFQEQAALWARLLDPKAAASQWADAAHTLKGAALSVGALRLAKVCETAEKLGRSDSAPSLAAAGVALSDIKDALTEALEACARTAHALSSAVSRRAS